MSSYTPTPFSLFYFSSQDSQCMEESQQDTGTWSEPYPTSTSSMISQTNSFKDSNLKSLNQFRRSAEANRQQTKCLNHCKNYQFICMQCKKMLCTGCLKYACTQPNLTISHETMSVAVYLNKLRQDTKCMVASDLQEHNLQVLKLKIEGYLKQIDKDSNEVTQLAQKCITQIKQNLSKTLLCFKGQKSQINKLFSRQVQNRCTYLKYTKAIQNILSQKNSQKDQIQSIVKNWQVLSQNFINSALKFNQLSKINEKVTIQNVKKSVSQAKELLVRTLNKNFNDFQKQLNQIMNINQNSSDEQPKSPKKSGSSKNLLLQTPSRLSLSIKTNENRTPSHLSRKKQREYLNSITNILNKQINKAPTPLNQQKSKRSIHTTIKKSNRKSNKQNESQVSTISIYGGKNMSQTCVKYNPNSIFSKTQQEKTQSQLKGRRNFSCSSHIGFGAIKARNAGIQGSKQNFSESLVIAGGYFNNQMTDCVFRVDYKRNKRQLVSRLSEPMAYFGVDSEFICPKNGQNKIIAYFCGGINQHCYPLSNFFAYELSPAYSVINYQQLQSMEQPRHSLSLTLHHSNLYAIGGVDSQNRIVQTVTKFHRQNKKWSKIGNLCYERANHQTISLRSGMYVVGGYNGQNWLRSIQRLDQIKGIFNVVMELRQGRQHFGIFPYIEENAFLVLGGKNYSQLSSCEYVSIKDKSSEFMAELQNPKSNIYCF